jgi:hypothetical protein
MFRLLPVLVGVLLVSASVQAQTPFLPQAARSFNLLSGSTSLDQASMIPVGMHMHAIPGENALPSSVTAVSHYRVSSAVLSWTIPKAYLIDNMNITMISINQRFTLPFAEGYLDSARMYLRLPLGEMRFDVMHDTVRIDQHNGMRLHDPNYYSALGQIDTSRVNFMQVDTSGLTLVRFNGKRVPKDFHIVAMPAIAGGLQSAFITATDTNSILTQQRGDDAGRMSFLGSSAGNLYLIQFYGIFGTADQKALDPNMIMIAYVRDASTTSADGATTPVAIALHANHPNPARGVQTEMPFTLERPGTVTLTVHDVMGRQIRTVASEYLPAGRHVRPIDVSDLPAGMYICRLHQNGQIAARAIHVVR